MLNYINYPDSTLTALAIPHKGSGVLWRAAQPCQGFGKAWWKSKGSLGGSRACSRPWQSPAKTQGLSGGQQGPTWTMAKPSESSSALWRKTLVKGVNSVCKIQHMAIKKLGHVLPILGVIASDPGRTTCTHPSQYLYVSIKEPVNEISFV